MSSSKKTKKKPTPLELDLMEAEYRIKQEHKSKIKSLKKLERNEFVPVIKVDPNDLEACHYEDVDVTVTEIKYQGFDNIRPVKDPKIDIKKEDPKVKNDKIKDLAAKAKQIKVTVGPKKGHPAEHRISGNYCYYVGGTPGMTLSLERDKPYIFKLDSNNIGAELIFTTDPMGSKGAVSLKGINSIKSGNDGLVVFGKDSPNEFYYQDKNHAFLGGSVKLK